MVIESIREFNRDGRSWLDNDSPALEALLLEARQGPYTPLTSQDSEAVKQRLRARSTAQAA